MLQVGENGECNVMLLGAPHQQRKSREGMVCAAAFRVGLDLSPPGDHRGLLFALTFAYLCLARIVAAYAAPASSPSDKSWVEGMAERSKREGVFEEETHDICVPVGRSFQKTPVSCEIALQLTWLWPARVQPAQVKVWGQKRGSCFSAMSLPCKK